MEMPETKYLDLAKEIILRSVPKDKYVVFLFGSRANGKSKRTSDIDVGVYGETSFPRMIKSNMEEELEESSIPYYVDIIDFKNVSEEFKKIALESIVVWHNPKNLIIK
jgi:predicted nucleotidyltransferase